MGTIGGVGGQHRLSIRISDDAHRGLLRVCEPAGVSITALAEAAGRLFLESPGAINPEILRLAQQIDMERRQRR